MKKKVAIIGSGFSGLSAACYLAKEGYQVDVFEKNDSIGGRARQFKTTTGFTFDMGPSWYWMPDIFEDFFNEFGYKTSDFYELIKLNPQFEIIFKDEKIDFPSDFNEMKKLFERKEKNSSVKLEEFMNEAQLKYEVGMKDFVVKPCLSWTEFISLKIAKNALKLDLLTNYKTYISKFFKNEKLKKIMEFPVIFLGAAPKNIPALYSLMNYGGYKLGTWYPKKGFFEIIKAMQQIAENQGVKIHTSSPVTKIENNHNSVKITVNEVEKTFDYVVASSDYHHTETLLNQEDRNYTEPYWNKKTFAPSCLLFYLGFDKKIKNLKHHTLFFDADFDSHINDIYEIPSWTKEPLFYACCPSKTDDSVAPEDCENLFLLIPLPPNIHETDEIKQEYLLKMIERIEKHTEENNLIHHVIYKKSFCVEDFKNEYNAFKGNAYGLANTLSQTAFLKPKIQNKKINRLYYSGQLTVPGPGVPPSIISGKIVANQIINN
jgi:phytoene desaturase